MLSRKRRTLHLTGFAFISCFIVDKTRSHNTKNVAQYLLCFRFLLFACEITERLQKLTTSFTLKIFTDEKQNKQTKENENKANIVPRFWCCVILFCLQ
jgi:hypothetical protein